MPPAMPGPTAPVRRLSAAKCRVKRIIPSYTWHGQLLDRLRAENPQPGDRVVLNPSNGPVPDDAQELAGVRAAVQFIAERQAIALGYVPLGYGARSVAEVLDDMLRWKDYRVPSIFFDEVPAAWSSAHINRLRLAATGMHSTFNPGTPLAGKIVGIPLGVVIVTHEGSTMPDRKPKPWEAALIHSGGATNEQLAAAGWQWGYATTDVLPNPWDGQS